MCLFENKIFFKDHRHDTNVTRCEFWCSQWERKSGIGTKNGCISFMAVVRLTCEPSCLKMSFHFPQGLEFLLAHRMTWLGQMQSEWRERSEQRALVQKMSVYGAESAESATIWPQTTDTQAKFWAAVCGAPSRHCPSDWENCLYLYCLTARKFSKSADYCYPYPYEPYPQFIEQKAAFLLFLINELIDTSIEDQLGYISGMVLLGEVTYKVEEVVVLKNPPILLVTGIVNMSL